MTFKQAVSELAKGKSRDALQVIFDTVEPLCKTRTDGNGGAETTLWDWLESGEYHASDTPQSIAAEWDELSQAGGEP